MKVALALFFSLALVGNASALHFWAGPLAGSTSDEWVATGTTNQWVDPTIAPPAFTPVSPPGAGDFAIVLDAAFGPTSLLPYPHIRTDVGTIGTLSVAPNEDNVAVLTIEAGGRLVVGGVAALGQNQDADTSGSSAGNSFGTLNLAGQMVAGDLQVGANAPTGAGQINLDAGFLHAGVVSFFDNANIDIEEGAFFFLNGDRTAEVQGWIDAGFITSNDGGTSLAWDFDSPNAGLTAIWAIPEPTTMVLLALGSLMLASFRRK